MRIAADARDTFECKIEGCGFEAGAGQEGDQEGAEAAVDVEGEGFFESEAGEARDVVDYAVGKVRGGAD